MVLPDPVGPGDQEDAARPPADLLGHLGQADLLEGQELVGDPPQHHAGVPLLLEDGDAEAGLVAVGEAEVAGAGLLELLLDALGRDRLHQRDRVLRLQRPWSAARACRRAGAASAACRRPGASRWPSSSTTVSSRRSIWMVAMIARCHRQSTVRIVSGRSSGVLADLRLANDARTQRRPMPDH